MNAVRIDTGRDVRCTYQGREYVIPEICLIGWQAGARLRGEPSTLADAIAWWAWQTELSEAERV